MADLTPYLKSPRDRRYEAEQEHGIYQVHVYQAVRHRCPTPPPGTAEDLRWLCDEFPERAKQFVRRADLHLLGISRNFGRTPEPLPIDVIERLLMSLNDPDTAAAVNERLEAVRV